MRNPLSSSSAKQTSKHDTTIQPTTTTPCCVKVGMKKGPWTPEEDHLLSTFINREGEGKWRTLPKRAGLLRCGKSCRLRWMNYLRPSIKRGRIAADEEDLILRLHRLLGNRWALIAGRIPGRTDNEIKNYWNTHLSKKLISQGIDPTTHKPLIPPNLNPKNTTPSSTFPKETTTRNKKSYFVETTCPPPPQVDSFNHVGKKIGPDFTNLISCNEPGGQCYGVEDEEVNYLADDTFSFLECLINDDPFPNPIGADITLYGLGQGVGWESGFVCSDVNQNDPKDG